jgi:hypothetical protein
MTFPARAEQNQAGGLCLRVVLAGKRQTKMKSRFLYRVVSRSTARAEQNEAGGLCLRFVLAGKHQTKMKSHFLHRRVVFHGKGRTKSSWWLCLRVARRATATSSRLTVG